MYNTFVALGTIALLLFTIAIIIAASFKKRLNFIVNNSHIIMRIIYSAALLGSLVYELKFGYEPCVLCWYQRIFIFSIAILLWSADIRTSRLLSKQVLILSILGFAVALFHNFIDIFPIGLDVCGVNGPSCTIRYVYEFGFVTIPLMSATILLSGIIMTLVAKSYPQSSFDIQKTKL